MNNTVKKICIKYENELKKQFLYPNKQERQYIKKMKNNILDFYEEASSLTIEDIYKEFGAPIDVAHNYYLINNDSLFLCNIQSRRKLHHLLLIFGLFLMLSTLFLGSLFIWEAKILSQKQVYYITTETIIHTTP